MVASENFYFSYFALFISIKGMIPLLYMQKHFGRVGIVQN